MLLQRDFVGYMAKEVVKRLIVGEMIETKTPDTIAQYVRKAMADELGVEDRSNEEVARRLKALTKAASGAENLMPYLYEAAKAYATLGEITDAMRQVFGVYNEVAVT